MSENLHKQPPLRWQQRYANFLRAMQALTDGVQLAGTRALTRARNLSSHTYNQSTATALLENIERHYFPAFRQLQATFATLTP